MFSTITHHDWRPRREWYNPGFKEDHVHTLFQSVNVCVDAFLDKLKPLADGTTTVQMKLHLEDFLTEMISKVRSIIIIKTMHRVSDGICIVGCIIFQTTLLTTPLYM